jgi:tetratricopeptide (TPR) repeat protein
MGSKGYSRRDLLFGILDRFGARETPRERTGFDSLSRDIDDLVRQARYREAIPELRRLLEKSPDHERARKKLGFCHVMAGHLEEGIGILQEMRDNRGRDNFVLLYLGLAHALREDPGRAVEVWRGYFNVDRPLIQRAVNLQIALYDSGVETPAREMAESVLEAIREQERNE